MNRRELTKLLGSGLLASALTPRIGLAAAAAPQVAITMDDFNLIGLDEQTAEKRNQTILSALRAHSVKAAIFVCGKAIDSALGQRLLKQWNDAELKEFLLTGATPDGDSADKTMEEVIRNTTSKLTPADLAAVIAYLRALPPLPEEPR